MDSLLQTSTQESAHGGVCIDIKRTQNLGDPTRIVSQICVPLLLLLGIVDAWAGKGSYLWGDSVSYVDMARGIAAGNLAATVNGLWSPLYPLLLAIFIRPFESSVAAEFCVVRVINFAIFLFSLVNFSIFLNRFVEYYVSSFGEVNSQRVHPSTWEFTLIAYSLFGWSYFALNEVSSVSPDSLVAGLTYALLAVLLSFAKGNLSWTNFIGFGMLLGIGYYAKFILLPIGLLCIAAAWSLPQARSVLARLLVSITIFIVLVAPMATALSLKYHRLTVGESGRLNYVWHVNQVFHWLHWQGGPPENGAPLHPTRLVLDKPTVYEFASPFNSAYPPWYDPAYWYAGVKVHLSVRQQVMAIYRNIRFLGGLLLFDWVLRSVALCAVILLIVQRHSAISRSSVGRFSSLWIVGIGTLIIYSVVHIEARYLPAVMLLLILLFLVAARLPSLKLSRWIPLGVAVLITASALASFGPRLAGVATQIIKTRGHLHNQQWSVADEFARVGIKPGTPVGSIGQSWLNDWALLARLRVVAEIPTLNNEAKTGQVSLFWSSSGQTQEAVFTAFRRAGAKVAIANEVPPWANTTDWIRVPNSSYYYKVLDASLTR